MIQYDLVDRCNAARRTDELPRLTSRARAAFARPSKPSRSERRARRTPPRSTRMRRPCRAPRPAAAVPPRSGRTPPRQVASRQHQDTGDDGCENRGHWKWKSRFATPTPDLMSRVRFVGAKCARRSSGREETGQLLQLVRLDALVLCDQASSSANNGWPNAAGSRCCRRSRTRACRSGSPRSDNRPGRDL